MLTGARQTPSRIASRPAVNSRSPAGSNAQVEELSGQVGIFVSKQPTTLIVMLIYCYRIRKVNLKWRVWFVIIDSCVSN